jgi:hypothetical protein
MHTISQISAYLLVVTLVYIIIAWMERPVGNTIGQLLAVQTG